MHTTSTHLARTALARTALALLCLLTIATACGDENEGSPALTDVTDTGTSGGDDGGDTTPDSGTTGDDGGTDAEPDTVENLPPTVQLRSPADGASFEAGEEVVVEVVVSDDRDAPEDLVVTLSSDRDGDIPFDGPDAEGVVRATTASLSVGVHTISASVTDTEGASLGGSLTLTILGNAPPGITIVAPLDGDTLLAGADVSMLIEVTDDSDDLSALTLEVRSDVDGELVAQGPNDGGSATVPLSELTVGAHTITASVEDSGGERAEASVSITIDANAPPEVTITAPTADQVFPPGGTVTFSGTVMDDRTPTAELQVALASDRDGALQVSAADDEGVVTATLTGLTGGEHQLTLYATDIQGRRGSASVTIQMEQDFPPNLVFQSPAEGAMILTSADQEIVLSVSDDRDPLASLSPTITSDRDGELAEGVPGPDGLLRVPTGNLSTGAHTITATCEDSFGNLAEVTLRFTIVEDMAPTVAFNAPMMGATFLTVDSVPVEVTVTDMEDAPGDLTVSVVSSLDGPIALSPVSPAGVTGAMTSLSAGSHTLTATVTDTAGQIATATRMITVEVDEAPTARFNAPMMNAVIDRGDPVMISLTVGDDRDPAQSLSVTLTSDLDGPLTIQGPDPIGTVRSSPPALSTGTHTLTATVTDSIGNETVVTRVFQLRDPLAPSVVFSEPMDDATFIVGDPITIRAVVADDRDPADTLALTLTSDIDGDLGIGAAAPSGLVSLTTSDLSLGEHTLVLTATDSQDASASAALTVRVIEDLPPTIGFIAPDEDATLIAGDFTLFQFQVGDDLDPVGSLDVTLDLVGIGSLATQGPNPEGLVSASALELPLGEQTARATVTDSRGQTSTAELTFSVVANAPPSITEIAPANDAEITFGDGVTFGMTVTDDLDALDELQLAIVSDLNGDFAVELGAEGRVTAFTDQLVPGDHVITYTAVDSRGARAEVSQALTVVPQQATLTLSITEDPTTLDDIVVSIVNPPEFPPGADVAYTWTVDEELFDVGPMTTIAAEDTARDEVWSVTLVVSSPTIVYTGVASTTVVNSAPTLESVTATPPADASPWRGVSLLCAYAGWNDVDGDEEGVEYAWYVGDGELVEGESGALLSLSRFEPGDVVSCGVTPTDGDLDGDEVVSAEVTVVNQAPSVTATITTEGPTVDDVITCVAEASDGDGDDLAYDFTWYAGEQQLTGVAGDSPNESVLESGFLKGDLVTCQVIVSDSYDTDEASDAATVLNTPPSIVGLPTLSPALIFSDEGTVVRCDAVVTDMDQNDDPAALYAFTLTSNGETTPIATEGNEIAFGFEASPAPGDVITCTATPTDGDDEGASQSVSATVLNRADYRRVFVTAGDYDGNLGGLEGADLNCAIEALEAELDGTWIAMLSSTTVHAADRLDEAGYITVTDDLIATDLGDLFDGNIVAPIGIDPFGDPKPAGNFGDLVWTGSDGAGSFQGPTNCGNWQEATANIQARVGNYMQFDSDWIDSNTSFCNVPRALYCVEVAPKIAFVTADTYDGDLGGLTGADDICNTEAAAAGRSGNFRGLLSTQLHNARSRVEDEPYTLPTGDLVAASLDDLFDGAIDAAINVDAAGDVIQTEVNGVWSASFEDGFWPEDYACGDWTDNFVEASALVGDRTATDSAWLAADFGNCDTPQHIYCFEVGADSDGDGLTDDEEAILESDPDDPDSNGDGVSDGEAYWDNGEDPNQEVPLLIITEYGEGSSFNKWLELGNTGGLDVNLGDYQIGVCVNGCADGEIDFIPLPNTTLSPGEVWVITNPNADNANLLAETDQFEAGFQVNGDDAIGLFAQDLTLIDVVGQFGVDPGSAWDVAGTSGATRDHTLIRRCDITSPNSDWASSAGDADSSDWFVFSQNYTADVGTICGSLQ